MSEYVKGIPMVFEIPEEDTFNAAVFPFELIGSYLSVQDIPQYSFELERKVKREISIFRDEMEMRTIHQMYQRRPQARRNRQQQQQLPIMQRASSTPVATDTPTDSRAMVSRPSAAIVHFDNTMGDSDDDFDSNAASGRGVGMIRVSPDTIKSRLPALKKPAEPRPVSTRIKSLFRSKNRSAPKA
ncbi:hypothetical protein H4R20_002241 [Coemansia guatemalensis]|uniref:Uncharacterized protein n=1 Tax=Coemansia guatemalensis TaxID=2761395 RepID=A0A9W8HVI0_9FUNG|nr:hypothetical protein H4R20_002241 [Coemansia guatemalensis]